MKGFYKTLSLALVFCWVMFGLLAQPLNHQQLATFLGLISQMTESADIIMAPTRGFALGFEAADQNWKNELRPKLKN